VIVYPVREVDRRLVAFGDGGFCPLWLLVRGSRCGNIARNGDAGPPEVIRNATDMKIDIIHFTKLLRCLLVVTPRLGVELNTVVAILALTTINGR